MIVSTEQVVEFDRSSVARTAVDLVVVSMSDTESVVFEPRSGETVLLNLVDRCALDCLSEEPISFEQWVERVAEHLQSSDVSDLTTYLNELSRQFEELGFCRRRSI